MCPVIRTSVSHCHLRHQFLLRSAFSGIQRVGADCLPEASSLKVLSHHCPHLLHSSSMSLLQGQLNGPLPPLLHFSIATAPSPWERHRLEAGVPDEEVLRSFPCSVVQSPPLHFAIIFACKPQALHGDFTSGGAIIVPLIKIKIFNLRVLFLHLGYRGQHAWTRKDGTIAVIYLLKD